MAEPQAYFGIITTSDRIEGHFEAFVDRLWHG